MLNLSKETQLVFFQKVFGPSHVVTKKVEALIAKGVYFSTSQLYTLKADYQGKVYQLGLNKGTTSLMKNTLTPVVAQMMKNQIAVWVDGVDLAVNKGQVDELKKLQNDGIVFGDILGDMGEALAPDPPLPPESDNLAPLYAVYVTKLSDVKMMIPAIKVVREITNWGLYEAKNAIEKVKNGESVKIIDSQEPLHTIANCKKMQMFGLTVKILLGGQDVTVSLLGGDYFAEKGNLKEAVNKKYEELAQAAKKANDEIKTTFIDYHALLKEEKPVASVIALKDAKAIGQQVRGTSSGSVYHCVALNDRVKIAARIYKTGGSVSLRAEWVNPTQQELKKLEEAGLSMKPAYASIHFSIGDVPVGRVIGAFLMGLEIQFKSSITYAGNLVTE